jgi:hypothetical protein
VLGAPSPGPPVVTWVFVLEALPDGHARLLVRARASERYTFHGLPTWVVKQIVPPGHFVMQRKQLLGIARRGEHLAWERRRQWTRSALRIAPAGLGLAAARWPHSPVA